MRDYIEYYFDNNGKFAAKIHDKLGVRVIKNEKNLLKLLQISQKHGYHVNHEGVIKRQSAVKKITKDFNKYIVKKNTLRIIGNILHNMKVSRKNVTLGKVVVAASIIAVLASHGIGKKNESMAADSTITTPPAIVEMVETDIPTLSEDVEIEAPTHENLEEKQEEKEVIEEKEEVKKDVVEEKQEEKKQELESMFSEDAFHYSYEDRSSASNISNAKRYEDIFEKYASRYGLDKNLLMAMAAQESSGDHYGHLDDGRPAAGIMQIEKSVHLGNKVKAYNFEKGEMEYITVTQDKLNNIDSNIQIGSMILREYIENSNYNIPLAIQTYNMGPGNMNKVLNTCGDLENVEVYTMKNNPTNNKWLNYRSFLHVGDSKYVEHVFSYLGKTNNLEVKKRDNTKVSVNIANDYMQLAKN